MKHNIQRLTATVEECSELLGISRGLAYELVHRGELPVLRLGRRLLVPRAALHRLLEQAANPSKGDEQL